MTRAPIYLVSACTSGDEFVAAFRRYADKNGLFIPIGVPLRTGRRARFAVTLMDGGVMIEGEAEVVVSAHTPSVLHGRVGMTLRFHEPDEASKTTLGELERARLAMRPAPPSIPPRPAVIPDEPRPTPPPLHGRIDAVNALAECVAIGDPDPPAAAPAPPPKAGPKFVAPVTPVTPATRPSSPITTQDAGVAAHRAAPLVRTPTAPQPDAVRDAAREPIVSGPTSDTFVAVAPPAEELPLATARTTAEQGVTPAPRHMMPISMPPLEKPAHDTQPITPRSSEPLAIEPASPTSSSHRASSHRASSHRASSQPPSSRSRLHPRASIHQVTNRDPAFSTRRQTPRFLHGVTP